MLAPISALVFAIIACVGSIYLSLGMGLIACPLCFYQRTFAFGLVGLLLVGLLMPNLTPSQLCILALPLAVGGIGVAGMHSYLVWSHKLECPLGIAEIRTAPEQSLLIFSLILVSLLAGAWGQLRTNSKAISSFLAAIFLGFAAAFCCTMKEANPAPKQADKPLTDPRELKTCQKPYVQS
jgi:disulfide bond formation protein DsbB